MKYQTCAGCGSNLDSNEPCDLCKRKTAASVNATAKSKKDFSKTTKKTYHKNRHPSIWEPIVYPKFQNGGN